MQDLGFLSLGSTQRPSCPVGQCSILLVINAMCATYMCMAFMHSSCAYSILSVKYVVYDVPKLRFAQQHGRGHRKLWTIFSLAYALWTFECKVQQILFETSVM